AVAIPGDGHPPGHPREDRVVLLLDAVMAGAVARAHEAQQLAGEGGPRLATGHGVDAHGMGFEHQPREAAVRDAVAELLALVPVQLPADDRVSEFRIELLVELRGPGRIQSEDGAEALQEPRSPG